MHHWQLSAIGVELLGSGILSATLVILWNNVVLFWPVMGLGVRTLGPKHEVVRERVQT